LPTLLLTQGVHPKVVSEMLGHSSIATTLDVYSHVIPGLGDAAALAMEDVLGTIPAFAASVTQVMTTLSSAVVSALAAALRRLLASG
jgi:hypothetical protein